MRLYDTGNREVKMLADFRLIINNAKKIALNVPDFPESKVT
jgi:hypothetical protein